MKKLFALIVVVLLAAPLSSQAAGKSVANPSMGKCLDVPYGKFNEGQPLQVWQCVALSFNQTLEITPTQITGNGMCLEVFDDNFVGLRKCTPFAKWTFRGGRLISASSGKCLVPASNDNGARVTVADCAGKPEETWAYTNWPWGGTAVVSEFDGRCLDVTAGQFVEGTKLQAWECIAGHANQTWTRVNDTYVAGGLCLDIKGGVFGGDAAVLAKCSGAATQKWTPKGATLVSSSGKCLASRKAVNGAPVVLDDCSKPSFRVAAASTAPAGTMVMAPKGEARNAGGYDASMSEMNAGLNANDPKSAVEHINKAISIGGFNDQNTAKAYVKLGKMQAWANDLAAADKAYDQALALWPDYGDALINKGRVAAQRGDSAKAYALFDKAAKLNQADYTDARLAKAELLDNEKKYDEAIKAMDEAISEDPDWHRSYFLRGYSHMMQGNYRAAIGDYDLAIARRNDNPEYYKARAVCKKELKDMKGAEADAQVYVQLGGQ